MALKNSKVAELLEGLAELMLKEVRESQGDEGIPLSASDKAVALALIKHCNVSSEPDSDKIAELKDAFGSDLDAKRAARAAALVAQTKGDGIDELMH